MTSVNFISSRVGPEFACVVQSNPTGKRGSLYKSSLMRFVDCFAILGNAVLNALRKMLRFQGLAFVSMELFNDQT